MVRKEWASHGLARCWSLGRVLGRLASRGLVPRPGQQRDRTGSMDEDDGLFGESGTYFGGLTKVAFFFLSSRLWVATCGRFLCVF